MRKGIIVLVLLLTKMIVAFSGCVGNVRVGGIIDTIQGSGDMVTHTIQVDGFTGIDIGGAYELTFQQSPNFSVVLEIQENLIEYLETSVQNGVFRLGSSANFRTTGENTPHLIISAPYLDYVSLAGAVNGNMNLQVDSLEINLAGASNLLLSGSANALNIHSAGASNISAFEMTATNATINVAGAGNVDIYATDTLHVSIAGIGQVVYDGEPQVTRSVAGLGTIERRSN